MTDPRSLSIDEQLRWLKRGTVEVVPEADLKAKLQRSKETGTPLRVKLGMDPSAPDIHLGHTVVMRKLRQFQELGHELYLIIGDFTGMIGDPTGKSETRKALTPEEVRVNAQTYADQVFKVLDPEHTHVVYNNEWLGEMRFADIIRLASSYTVARLLERDEFAKRFAEERPISVHEFMYPLSQAYDSVHLRADVELGGTDQRFNVLLGRDIQQNYGQEAQVAVLMPILVGLDGSAKMSKSLNNYVGVTDDPQSMFSKLMSISDGMMPNYYELLTELDAAEYMPLVAEQPMEAKKRLAAAVTTQFHSVEAAEEARGQWERIFSRRELPTEMPEVPVAADQLDESGRIWIGRLLVHAALVQGTREARRMIEQGAVAVDGEKLNDPDAAIEPREGMVLQVGRRKFVRLRRC
jgi:tyrosyl-tRNA synthetase